MFFRHLYFSVFQRPSIFKISVNRTGNGFRNEALEWRENWLTELKEAEHMQIAASSFSLLDWRTIKEQDRNNDNIKSSFREFAQKIYDINSAKQPSISVIGRLQ